MTGLMKVEGTYYECPTCTRRFFFEHEHDPVACVDHAEQEAERRAEYKRKSAELRDDCLAFARTDPVFRQMVADWPQERARMVADRITDEVGERLDHFPDSSIFWQSLHAAMLAAARESP